MKGAWQNVRSALLWIATALHFFPLSTLLFLLSLAVPPRRFDRLVRALFRNVLRVAGAAFAVRFAPGFDRSRTYLFFANHVNIFDPFVLYSAVPQFVRGVELESHFKIPGYGWMARRFGNIPLPDSRPGPSALRRLMRQMEERLAAGTSLIVFPEGGRTRDGRVREFRGGVFRIAQQLGYPVVPVSIVGSFEFHRTGDWRLYPGRITVYVHEPLETKDLRKEDLDALREHVREIVAAPVHAALDARNPAAAAALPGRAPE